MLTDEQLKKLSPLCEHPRYGKLLSDAIEIWKKENVFPKFMDWGIFKYIDKENNIRWKGIEQENIDNEQITETYVCLLGAALIDKITNEDETKTFSIIKYYNFDFNEIQNLVLGFDQDLIPDKKSLFNENAYNFTLKVSKIIFGNMRD